MKHISVKYTSVIVFLSLITFVNSVNAQSLKKIRVSDVSFTGISAFSKDRLSRIMITRSSRFLSPHYYNENIFHEDIKALELFYYQNGYFDAAITDFQVNIDSTRTWANIDITISEGELTYIESVTILGNTIFPDSLLLEKIHILPEEPYRQKKIDDSTLNILTFYANNGYLDAEVKPDIHVNPEKHRVLIDLYIIENSQFTVGNIQINGLEKTQENVIMRKLIFHSDQVINYARLLESQRKIYMTGLFQSVYIYPKVSSLGDSVKKDIHIDVKENMSGEFNIALGFGSVDRIRVKTELYNNNVRGTSLKLGLAGKMSYIEQSVESSFTNPNTFGTPLSTDFNIIKDKKDEPGYILDRTGAGMTIGYNFNRNNVLLTYNYARTKLSDLKVDIIPDDLKSNTRSLKLSFIHDTRDNLFNPIKGFFFEASGELGTFYAVKTTPFYRFSGQIKYYYPLNQLTVVATSVELGFIENEGNINLLPLHERFYAGGPNSLRGFDYQKVGPLDSKRLPVGGKCKLVLNLLEIRRTIYKMVGSVVFIDIGNVWTKPEDINLRDMRIVPGIGLRVNSPIGLGRIDYGINVDKQENESKGHLYFSIGQAF